MLCIITAQEIIEPTVCIHKLLGRVVPILCLKRQLWVFLKEMGFSLYLKSELNRLSS